MKKLDFSLFCQWDLHRKSLLGFWENATVEWLSEPKHFQPAYLPKMKVPDESSMGGVYTSKEEYFNTILTLLYEN